MAGEGFVTVSDLKSMIEFIELIKDSNLKESDSNAIGMCCIFGQDEKG